MVIKLENDRRSTDWEMLQKCQGAIHLRRPHGGGGVRLRWTHVDWTGWRGQAPCGRPHRKLKLKSTDVILSSSHAKKLASFYQNFVFGQNKKWKFLGNIN